MSKRPQRWPIWKISVATAGCAVASGVLFWLSTVVQHVGKAPTTAPAAGGATALPSFVLMMGVLAAILALLGVLWLVIRIREARTPVWKRHKR